MKNLNKDILSAIKNNSTVTNEELALRLNCSKEEIEKSRKQLEDEGVIVGYSSIINYDKTDDEIVTAMIEVKVIPQKGLGFDHIAERIYKFPEVDSVYLMSGGFDFMVLIEGRSIKEVSRFVFEKLATLEYVSSTATHFVLKKYKDHGIEMSKLKEDIRIQGNL